MKLLVSPAQLSGFSPEQWLRRLGYALIESREGGVSFVRRLSGGFYPRFHLYVEPSGDKFSFNLHLDQKKASYEGITRHSGEYDGELVAEEINRLKQNLGGDLFA
ncbi:MAG: hypothetical protein WC441_02310 [Patescibacteria group bacterium]